MFIDDKCSDEDKLLATALQLAVFTGDIVVAEALDPQTGDKVPVVCVRLHKAGQEVAILPVALLLRAEHAQRLCPPHPDGGYYGVGVHAEGAQN